EGAANGAEAAQHSQYVLLNTVHLDDVMEGLAFLKSAPGIDPHRLAVVGHSFGGQLTLLAAERDTAIRAAVALVRAPPPSPAPPPEVRARLLPAPRSAAHPALPASPRNQDKR